MNGEPVLWFLPYFCEIYRVITVCDYGIGGGSNVFKSQVDGGIGERIEGLGAEGEA